MSTAVEDPPAADEPAGERGGVQKLLDVIERVGNRVPHPAIIFLGLIVIVMLLSALLSIFDVGVTYEVAEPVQVAEVAEPVEPPIVDGEYSGDVDDEAAVRPDGDGPLVVGTDEGPLVARDQWQQGGSDLLEPYPDLHDYAADDVVIVTETTSIRSLLGADGIRFIFSNFVNNFASFSVVAVIFVAMIGVGVAEEAGLMAALIRKLVKISPPKTLAFIIVFVGGLSNIATDAGYLILIPLGAAAFLSVGRNPLAGLAAAYAGVSASFSVNILITPLDSLLTEVTNGAIELVPGNDPIDLTANLWWNIASTFAMAIVMTIIVERITEKSLGPYEGTVAAVTDEEVPAGEPRGLRLALYGFLAGLAVVVLLSVFPSAPLRNPETGDLFNNSPLMDGLIFIITLLFLVAGICFGIGAKTISTSTDVINGIVKTFAGLSGLIFLLLLISQFIAFFNFSNLPTVIAVGLAHFLESASIGPLWLLLGFIVVILILDLIIPGALPKWAIFAPIFVPLFINLGVAPQTVLAAYRLGDSPMNVITPLMVYLPFIVLVAQRYKPEAGLGTIISLMIPYTAIVMVTWIAMFVVWYALGIPMGPGYPAKL